MAAFPDGRQIRTALGLTRKGLDLPDGASLENSELSVFIKYLLLEGLADENLDRQQNGEARLCRRLEDLMDCLDRLPLPGGELSAALRHLQIPSYRSHAFDLAWEALLSERLAPETCLFPEPMAASKSGHDHAVVFSATAGFSHEFYALAVDAYERDSLRHGQPSIRLLGVHRGWLDGDGCITRSILLDPERNRLAAADWDVPFRPDSAQFLCLGRRDQASHRELAARFHCPQLNPYAPSALADDKAATLAGWSNLGLEVPAFRLIGKGDWQGARRFAAEYAEIVVKPNLGTEGRDVSYLSGSESDWEGRLSTALQSCWRQGDALIQARRDGVLFRDPELGCLHTLAVRLNLVYDGRRHRLASGFAQIGVDPGQPASRGRGGLILPLGEVLPHLVSRHDPAQPLDITLSCWWDGVARKAEKAASLFDELLLVGLDMLIDLAEDGSPAPVFLEANPRPGGLCHSRLLSGPPSRRDRAGVGLELWDGVEALRADAAMLRQGHLSMEASS